MSRLQLSLVVCSIGLLGCGPELLGSGPNFLQGGLGGSLPPVSADAGRALTAPPRVLSNRPGSGTLGAPTNTTLGVTFTQPMDPATINADTFTLQLGATAIPGTISYSGKTATFAPSVELPANATLVATVSRDARDLLGQSNGEDYYWIFHTGAGPSAPEVIALSPRRSALSVDRHLPTITATFNTTLDAQTLNERTMTVLHRGLPVAGTVRTLGGMAIFTLSDAALEPLSTYDVRLSGLQGSGGEPMAADCSWSFTTQAAGL